VSNLSRDCYRSETVFQCWARPGLFGELRLLRSRIQRETVFRPNLTVT
jgi:hypothetical protein